MHPRILPQRLAKLFAQIIAQVFVEMSVESRPAKEEHLALLRRRNVGPAFALRAELNHFASKKVLGFFDTRRAKPEAA